MGMAVDWLKIKTEYINGGTTHRELAKKYGVSARQIGAHSKAEQWAQAREENLSKISAKVQRKTQEKIVDSESEALVIKSRLKLSFYQQIEKRLQSVDKEDGQEFRRLVQNFKDMCDIHDADGKQQTTVEDDPITRSLKEAADALTKANEDP